MFERLVAWSVVSGVLWLAGAALDGDQRLLLWIPALALDLAAPVAGYWLPGRGRAATTDYDIEGGHFAERCQLFIIIALGESIVVTGATAADAGLTSTVVLCLVVAFLETAALWWLYFGAAAEHSRAAMSASDDPGRLARDAYTYLHLPIVAGIIATAVGDDLLIADPHDPLHGVGLAMVLGGPALFLLGESLFRWRTTGKAEHQAPGGRRAAHPARAARRQHRGVAARRDRRRAARRAGGLGVGWRRSPAFGSSAILAPASARGGGPRTGTTRRTPNTDRGGRAGGPIALHRPRISEDGTHDEHPAARDEMLQVIRQALDVLARLLLPPLHRDDLRDQHVIGLIETTVRARPPAA